MRKLFAYMVCYSSLLSGSLNLCQAQDLPIAEAVAEATAVAEPAESERPTPAIRPLTVTVGLTDDTRITGTLLDSTALPVKTAFGEASIPLSEVAGIRFPSAEDTSTTIVMLNGDSITGATDLKFVSVETSWGSAKINGQSVSNMLFVPGLSWTSQENLGGKRWALVEAKPAAPPTTPQTPNFNPQGFSRNPQPPAIFNR